MSGEEFARLANNFYISRDLESHVSRIQVDADLFNYIVSHESDLKNKYKVALVFICLNPLYWEFVHEMVSGATKFLLPSHEKDFFFWTDIPQNLMDAERSITEEFNKKLPEIHRDREFHLKRIPDIIQGIKEVRELPNIKIIPTEATEWPYPTLLRYNLFLQQEEQLKDYDYIFYCDIDMKFEAIVGDEVLGDITACQHPMYALRKEYWPPYEPNENSASYIKRPGRIITDNGQDRFMPLYYAGGFQGGKASNFIQAMKDCKALVDSDLNKGYIPIWNDETVWNKWLSDHPADKILTPAYIYPDSLIEQYYIPLWGRNYQPKLKTLTKWFSLSVEGGEHIQQFLK